MMSCTQTDTLTHTKVIRYVIKYVILRRVPIARVPFANHFVTLIIYADYVVYTRTIIIIIWTQDITIHNSEKNIIIIFLSLL